MIGPVIDRTRGRMIGPMIRAAIVAAGLTFSLACHADYRATADPATILYDAPSARAKPLFVYGRDVPVEVLVSVEGWTKVRDASGTIGWIARRSLSDKRMIEVRAPGADVRAAADDSSPVVFRADADVLLEVAERATSPATAAVPGWVRVRHRDGQTGFVRLAQVFGF